MNDLFIILEKYLKMKDTNNKIIGNYLPSIRYFDGTNKFSDLSGNYESDTLEGSFKLFIKSLG